ncbi:MAG: hypothetical protein K0Q95_1527 [Bacteroidota bacterium]|jgi:hypothetical protein|nr:hypothetical protein [Bacteroidota bacterium]
MNRLEIPEGGNTPHIVFDPASSLFIIEGKSFPEDSKEFYRVLIEWLEGYKAELPSTFQLKFNLFYLSSSSIISVKQILLKLQEYQAMGCNVIVVWNYDEDDDDIKKTGEDYMKITKLPFKFAVND